MSIHRSLAHGDNLKRHKNVLPREERIAKLTESGKFKTGENSVFGLPKVANRKVVVKKKEKKEEGAAVAGAAPAAPAATPAAK